MIIRKYKTSDLNEIIELFYNTVHSVNAKDYSQQQLNAWADGNVNAKEWNSSFLSHTTLAAEENNILVGFADMDASGYLDRLYVHKDFQRRGIASALCKQLENLVNAKEFTTHSSITAKPFFEKIGYREIKEQKVFRHGIPLINYIMKK